MIGEQSILDQKYTDEPGAENADALSLAPDRSDESWIKLARSAYESSTTWFDSNVRAQIEDNLAAFQGKHPKGSKYYSDAYKYRSRIFRPKIRSALRRSSAACASAFFSTSDVVSVQAQNQDDPVAAAGAKLRQELINYRLSNTVPWFATLVGAHQDADTVGLCISYQDWEYSINEQTGAVERDTPVIRLVPAENLRFDPGADWIDPVGMSPYIIELIPMYVIDIEARMRVDNPRTGDAAWRPLSRGEILQARGERYDTTRQSRDGGKTPASDAENPDADYTLVWVHRNIVRRDGQDWLYYTAGVNHLLSDPVPMADRHPDGRPYVIGFTNIESHRVWKTAKPELGAGLQQEANDIANQRLDNVRLAMNKQFFARRNGGDIDFQALLSSVPGGVTLMNDPVSDVRVIETNDVTGSSYAEQDRVNLDFDELMGVFSMSSVNSNRKTAETVGGMAMMSADANQVQELELRTFAESWVEPVLRQVLALIERYESDQEVLAIAGGKAKTLEQGDPVQLLRRGKFRLSVNVGFGTTNPDMRVARLVNAVRAVAGVSQRLVSRINDEELIKEVMGAVGLDNGARFFLPAESGDPRVAELQQQLQALMAEQGDGMSVESEKVKAQAEVEKQRLIGQQKLDEMAFASRLMHDPMASPQHQIDAQIANFANQFAQTMQSHTNQMQSLISQVTQAVDQINRRVDATAIESNGTSATQSAIGESLLGMHRMVAQVAESQQRMGDLQAEMAIRLAELSVQASASKSVERDAKGNPTSIHISGIGRREVRYDQSGKVIGVGELIPEVVNGNS